MTSTQTDRNNLCKYLNDIGLAQYAERFIDEGFDRWNILCDITEADLDVLGVKRGHRRVLQRAINDARERYAGTGALPPPLPQEPSTSSSSSEMIGIQRSFQHAEPDTQIRSKRKYRRHPKPDPHAPEKPPSAYVVFSNKTREEFKDEGLSFTDMAKRVGQLWQALPGAQREVYEREATAAKENFSRLLAEYKLTKESQEYQLYLVDFKKKNGSDTRDGKRMKISSDADVDPSEGDYTERLSRSESRDDDAITVHSVALTARSSDGNYPERTPAATYAPASAPPPPRKISYEYPKHLSSATHTEETLHHHLRRSSQSTGRDAFAVPYPTVAAPHSADSRTNLSPVATVASPRPDTQPYDRRILHSPSAAYSIPRPDNPLPPLSSTNIPYDREPRSSIGGSMTRQLAVVGDSGPALHPLALPPISLLEAIAGRAERTIPHAPGPDQWGKLPLPPATSLPLGGPSDRRLSGAARRHESHPNPPGNSHQR